MKARSQIDNKAVEKIAEIDHDLEQMKKMQPQMKCESRLSIGGTKGAWLVWSRISGLISGLSWGSLGAATVFYGLSWPGTGGDWIGPRSGSKGAGKGLLHGRRGKLNPGTFRSLSDSA